jgi:hypothetical protein
LLSLLVPNWRLRDELALVWRLGQDHSLADLSGHKGNDDFRFRISAEERLELFERIQAQPQAVICENLLQLAQVRLLLREGAWLPPDHPHPQLAATAHFGPTPWEINR